MAAACTNGIVTRRIALLVALALSAVCALRPARAQDCIRYWENAHITAEMSTRGACAAVSLFGSNLLVADTAGVRYVDVRNPYAPGFVAALHPAGRVVSITVSGSLAYLMEGPAGIEVATFADPYAPAIVGSLMTLGAARAMTVVGQYGYLANGESGLVIVDLSDPLAPTIVGSVGSPGTANDVAVSGDYAYLAVGNAGFRIFDITNPASPFLVGGLDTQQANGVVVSEGYAYVADGSAGILKIDVSDPANPYIVGSWRTAGEAIKIVLRDEMGYLADGSGGITLLDTHSQNLVQGRTFDVGTANMVDVAFSKGFVFAAGSDAGLIVIDFRDPTNPRAEVGHLWTYEANELAFSGNNAYIADGIYLRVADVSDPRSPFITGSVGPLSAGAEDVAIVGHYAYVASGGLLVVDVADPYAPVVVGNWHINTMSWRVAIAGNLAYVTCGTGIASTFKVLDISNPYAPSLVSSIDLGGYGLGLSLAGNYAFLSVEHSFVTVDVSRPAAPFIAGMVDLPGRGLANKVVGDIAYVAASEGGLVAIDVGDPTQPRIVGTAPLTREARDVEIDGGIAYVASGYTGLQIVDMSDLSAPIPLGAYETMTWNCGITLHGGYLYAVENDAGTQVLYRECGDFAAAPEETDRPALDRVFPTPSRGGTTIRFDVPRRGACAISIHDASGRVVASPPSRAFDPGTREFVWNGRDDTGRRLPAGVYYVRLMVLGKVSNARVVLVP